MFEELKAKIEELNKAVAEKASTTEDTTKALDEKIKSLESQIQDLNEKIAKGLEVPGYDEEEKRGKKFSFAKAIKASVTGNWEEAAYEKEVSDTIAKTVNSGTGAGGGFLSPTMESMEVIDLAIANRPILNDMGITRMTGLENYGEITMPKMSARQTAYWVGQEGAATESNPTFGQIRLSPKYLRALSCVSRSLLQQSPNIVEPIVRQGLGDSTAVKLETALIAGAGAANEPKGIVYYDSVQTEAVGTNGGRVTWKIMDNMVADIEEADHTLTGNLGFVTHPKVKKLLRQEQVAMYSGDTNGEFRVGVPVKNDAELEAALGYKLRTTTLVPSNLTKGSGTSLSYVIFGDWAQILLAMWGNLEIRVSEHYSNAFTQNQLYIASFLTCDINVKDETKFSVLSDAATSA